MLSPPKARSGRSEGKDTVGEVYLDKVDGLSTPEIDEGDPRETEVLTEGEVYLDWVKYPGDRWMHKE